MPTSTNVTNLKINELTEAQYDAAVQSGVIGENEISILTDVEAGQVIQVDTMPTASAAEGGKIYQYIGTTDANYINGYFYKCTATGDPVVYSWTQTDVQPTSSGLPDQTGQSGKFLTTDGTNASWNNTPVEVNTSYGSIKIASPYALPNSYANIVIGTSAWVVGAGNIAIGRYAQAQNGSVHLGNMSTDSVGSIGILGGVGTNADYAIQLGGGVGSLAKNRDANTFKVANANGNFELMSADGTIPKERLANVVSMPATMPQLTVDGWNSNTQTVNVTGVTADNVVFVSPAPLSTTEYAQCGVACIAQAAGTLTFTCTTVPENALTVNVICL